MLPIASGSPIARYAIQCAPPLSRRGPFLDRGDCRQATTDFHQRFPSRDAGGEYIYTLTHSTRSGALYPIKCPYVIAYPNCVFTLDYTRYLGGDLPHFHTDVAEFWGTKLARSCVGKAPQEMVDGGDVTWEYPSTSIRIALAHTAKPFEETDGNSTSVGNSIAALVSSAESNVTFSTNMDVPVDISDSK